MKKRSFCLAIVLLAMFVLWTIAVSRVDVRTIGPQESSVGFAALNGFVHNLTGVHMLLYTITDWLGLVPIALGLGFALLGLVQWIKRKHLLKVDRSILVLGGFYILVMAAYLFFESFVINYRPVLIEGILEASYPSSTTMLVLSVMPTAELQLRERLRNRRILLWIHPAITAFTAFASLQEIHGWELIFLFLLRRIHGFFNGLI